jgi:hypothetical protein
MEPPRLIDDQLDDFERALLRSARVDEPDVHAIARAALALGVGTTAVTLVAGTAAASSATVAGSSLGTLSKLATLGVFKWLSVGVVAGVMTTAGVELARTAIRPADQPAAPEVARPLALRARSGVSRPPQQLSPIPEPPAHEPEVVDESAPSEAPRPLKHGAVPAAPVVPETAPAVSTAGPANANAEPPPVSSIAEEIASLQRARRGLAAGNPSLALAELDHYERHVRARALGAEAAVLRVEALLQAGQRAAAVALARRLLAAQPQGLHAARLRRIAEATP